MITIRPSDQRGRADYGWLQARYSFSFARYFDPAHTGFRALRVINQDVVAPGRGFPEHPHDNMEIITYVISGAIAHRDSTGAQRTVRPGQIQHMSAGSGVTHSEFNPSKDEPLHLLQVWIEPARQGVRPAYNELTIDESRRRDGLVALASPDGRDGSIAINADARVSSLRLPPGRGAALALAPGRHAWVQVVRGRLTVNGAALGPGDGAAISDEPELNFRVTEGDIEALVFDLT